MKKIFIRDFKMNWIRAKDKLPNCWSQQRDDHGSGYLFGFTKKTIEQNYHDVT